jgi:hypothetical protein
MPTRTRDARNSHQGSSKSGGTSSTAKSSTQQTKSAKSAGASSAAAIPVPYLTAQLHTHRVELPSLPGSTQVTETVTAVRDRLPSTETMLFYGGLTAAAAFSVIEWPVAAAIGIGTAVVQRGTRKD